MAAVVGVALLGSATGVQAQPDCPPPADLDPQSEMRFTVQERPGRLPVLLAEGLVDRNVVERLRLALDGFRGEEIWLRSPGGYVGADRDAGRLIREHGLRTRVPAGWTCRGACTIMFMGGVARAVDDGGQFIVNMFAHTGEVSNYVEVGGSSRAVATEDYDYLLRMGVSPRLLSDVMYRQPVAGGEQGRCLSRAELARYGVTTRPARRD